MGLTAGAKSPWHGVDAGPTSTAWEHFWGDVFFWDWYSAVSYTHLNYTRRFKDTDLFEQIFQRILEECYRFKLVDSTEIFVDATHVKARANNRKMQKRIAKQEALFYADMLRQDINADREAHGKKPLKDKDDNNKPGSGGNDKFEDYTDDVPSDEKTIKCSTTDPESGWFRKGEHKHVFAYGIDTACDKNGWIIDFTVNPGNEHDSRTFKGL